MVHLNHVCGEEEVPLAIRGGDVRVLIRHDDPTARDRESIVCKTAGQVRSFKKHEKANRGEREREREREREKERDRYIYI